MVLADYFALERLTSVLLLSVCSPLCSAWKVLPQNRCLQEGGSCVPSRSSPSPVGMLQLLFSDRAGLLLMDSCRKKGCWRDIFLSPPAVVPGPRARNYEEGGTGEEGTEEGANGELTRNSQRFLWECSCKFTARSNALLTQKPVLLSPVEPTKHA